MIGPALALGLLTVPSLQSRLVERRLADIAAIAVPRGIKDETSKGVREDQIGRLTFSFSTTYFWASFGSGPAYGQKLWVSVMAPDATDAEYAAFPEVVRSDVRRPLLLPLGQCPWRPTRGRECVRVPLGRRRRLGATRRSRAAWGGGSSSTESGRRPTTTSRTCRSAESPRR